MSKSTEDLINEILKGSYESDINGDLLNDLLEDFQKGFPVVNLLPLIKSQDRRVSRAGSWILSELGTKACEVFHETKSLIHSFDPKVRFYYIDCILVCAGEEDGDSIKDLLSLLEDEVAFVRWRSMDALCRLSESQLLAGISWMNSKDGGSTISYSDVQILQDSLQERISFSHFKELVKSENLIQKKLAIIAAIRKKLEPKMVCELAEFSKDEEIIDFCKDLPSLTWVVH
ncbi:hypothetical protein IQ254_24325 [Nodosilinea sp. LEGE 07088]|uniref:HEAT repeat domain-containing protein n=1 Tax=Nodosilinea sp. LEGE 07088 TaxID=2777968 RepID=UPI00188291E5|nr:hypothetical protein [Nodosilinea sp. LEGE 07088]MBE9140286.1 hypothetical protein [Nodosilinea sp. LEGE 07088]